MNLALAALEGMMADVRAELEACADESGDFQPKLYLSGIFLTAASVTYLAQQAGLLEQYPGLRDDMIHALAILANEAATDLPRNQVMTTDQAMEYTGVPNEDCFDLLAIALGMTPVEPGTIIGRGDDSAVH